MEYQNNFFNQASEDALFKHISLDTSNSSKINKISIFHKILYSVSFFIIFDLFRSPPFLWFLLVAILELSQYSPNRLLGLSTLLPFLLITCSRLLKFFFAFKTQITYEKNLNQARFIKLKEGNFTEVKSSSLKEGDIILLRQNQRVPADCIILSINSNYKYGFVSLDAENSGEPEVKAHIKEIHNLVMDGGLPFDDITTHIEELKVLRSNEKCKEIVGKIKLKGSPTYITIKNDNFLTAGGTIIECEWVLGIAVKVGNEMTSWLNYKLKSDKFSPFFPKMNLTVLLYFCFMGILIFINLLLYRKSDNESISDILIQTIILYSNTVQISFYLIIEILDTLNWVFYLKNKASKINNFTALSKLSSIEYIITEKVGILTGEEVKVQSCFVNQTMYDDSEDIDESHLNNPADLSKSLIETVRLCEGVQILPFSQLKEDLKQEDCQLEKWLFALALLICNSRISRENACINSVDRALIKFAFSLGLEIQSSVSKKITVLFNGVEYPFTKIAINCNNISDQKFKGLIKDETSGLYYLISKDSNLSKSCLEDPISDFNTLTKLYFLYKALEPDEVQKFTNEYKEAEFSLINKSQRIATVFEFYETNMKLLGIVGYDNIVKPETINCVKSILKSGIKIWIASSQNEESVLATAHKTELFDSNVICLRELPSLTETIESVKRAVECYMIRGERVSKERKNTRRSRTIKDREQHFFHPLLSSIGIGLEGFEEFNKIGENCAEYSVCVSAGLLRMGFESRELMNGLVLLLFTARSAVFYDLLAEDKRKIVKFLQEEFHFKPKVLSIGYRESDIKMIAEGYLGVRVEKDCKKTGFFSDISIKGFSELEDLILNQGFNNYYRLVIVQSLTTFKVYCMSTVLFLYQYLANFSASPIIFYDVLVIYELVISLFFIVMVSFCYTEKNQFKRVSRYSANFLSNKKKNFNSVFDPLFAVFSGIIIHFVVTRCMQGINTSGFTEDFTCIGVTLFLLVNLALFISAWTMVNTMLKYVVFSCLSIVLLIIVVTSQTDTAFIRESYSRNSIVLVILCVYPLFFIVFTYTWRYFTQKLVKFKLVNRLKDYSNRLDLLFTGKKNRRGSLSPNNLEIDKMNLRFSDETLEKEYKNALYEKIKVNLRVYMVLIVIISVVNEILTELNLGDYLAVSRYYFITLIGLVILMVLSFILVPRYFLSFEIFLFILHIANFLGNSVLNRLTYSFTRQPAFLVMFCLELNTNWTETIIKASTLYLASIFSVFYQVESSNLAILVTIWSTSNLLLSVLILYTCYINDLNIRKEFDYIQKASNEVHKSSAILAYLLPDFVRIRVKEGIRYIAEDKGTVSIIFFDIYSFDEIVQSYNPQELTGLLNSVFGKIDKLCESYGVTKIETVGKTYMACAGLKDSESDFDLNILNIPHARRAVELSLTVIQESKKFILKDGKKLSFKIGINSGPVTAGVVGYHKPQFSLVGDTVNTASRMASTLTETDIVQIAMITYDMLGDHSGLIIKDARIEAKGKGKMDTKLIYSRNNQELGPTNSFFSLSKRRSSSGIFGNVRHSSATKDSLLANLGIKKDKDLFRAQTRTSIGGNFSVSCKETEAEKKFKKEFENEIERSVLFGLTSSVLFEFLLIIIEIISVKLDLHYSSKGRLISISLAVILKIVCLAKRKTILKKQYFCYILSSLYLLEEIGVFVSSLSESDFSFIDYMYYIYLFILLNYFTGTLFGKNIYFNVPFILLWLAGLLLTYLSYNFIVYTVTFIFITLFSVYSHELNMRKNTILKNLAEKELKKTQELLTQMMPPQALDDLEKGLTVIDKVKNVTILYADIVGFTAWSSSRNSTQVVDMLSELFSRFDQMCVEHSVYKVHTIGDCYVAMGYVSDKNRNPAKEACRIVDFGISLIEVIQETNEKCGISLGMRIGIHTGDIIGGIIGTKIVRYDIYGSDVLIANKMESNGTAGKVSVSEATKSLLEDFEIGKYLFEESNEIFISSLEMKIKMYFVMKVEGDKEFKLD